MCRVDKWEPSEAHMDTTQLTHYQTPRTDRLSVEICNLTRRALPPHFLIDFLRKMTSVNTHTPQNHNFPVGLTPITSESINYT